MYQAEIRPYTAGFTVALWHFSSAYVREKKNHGNMAYSGGIFVGRHLGSRLVKSLPRGLHSFVWRYNLFLL
jgi:hypothetical protein